MSDIIDLNEKKAELEVEKARLEVEREKTEWELLEIQKDEVARRGRLFQAILTIIPALEGMVKAAFSAAVEREIAHVQATKIASLKSLSGNNEIKKEVDEAIIRLIK